MQHTFPLNRLQCALKTRLILERKTDSMKSEMTGLQTPWFFSLCLAFWLYIDCNTTYVSKTVYFCLRKLNFCFSKK